MPNTLKVQGQLKVQGLLLIGYIPKTFIWTGSGDNNTWTTTSNWDIQLIPFANDNFIFAGNTRLAPFNDLAANTFVRNITFAPGAGAFVISGNRFILNSGSITNNSSNTQTINSDIVLGSNAIINCNTAAIGLSGTISGSGSLTKLGTSTLSLSGNNSYTGNTFISTGAVNVFNSNPFGTGDVFFASTAGTITVEANSIPSTVVINNRLKFDNIITPNLNKSVTFNGVVTLASIGQTNITTRNAGTVVTFNNTLSGLSTNTNNLFAANTLGNAMIFNAPVIFDGTTTFQADNGGGGIYTFNSIGNKVNSVRGSGLFICGISNAFSEYRTGIVIGKKTGSTSLYGQVDLNGTDQTFNTIGNSNSVFTDCSGCNVFNNTLTTSNLTLTGTTGTGITTYTGSISGNINLIKFGTNTQILSGSTAIGVGPRYTGFTAISAGTLRTYTLSSNPSDKVSDVLFQSTSLVVNFATPPTVGEAYILLPGRTINTYSTGGISFGNGGGLRGTYNSTTSTLSVIT